MTSSLERGNTSPWKCKTCGEWETTDVKEPTFLEQWKGWKQTLDCPRCYVRQEFKLNVFKEKENK